MLCQIPWPPQPLSFTGTVWRPQPLPPWKDSLSYISFQCLEVWPRSRDTRAPVHTRCHPWRGASSDSNAASQLSKNRPPPQRQALPAPHPHPPGLTKDTDLLTSATDKFIEVLEKAYGQRINKRHGTFTEPTGSLGRRFAGITRTYTQPAFVSGDPSQRASDGGEGASSEQPRPSLLQRDVQPSGS